MSSVLELIRLFSVLIAWSIGVQWSVTAAFKEGHGTLLAINEELPQDKVIRISQSGLDIF